jgi:hypothetical protein
MRRLLTAVIVLAALVAGCSSANRGNTGATSVAMTSSTGDPEAADAALILTMYDTISTAFQRNPDDGVRAIIDTQYPADIKDVDFARCVAAISPGAKTLPRDRRMHFAPQLSTVTADAGYTVNSDRVKGLRPQGRIYETDVVISDGKKPTVRSRHQVIFQGRAYQFSSC